MTNSTSDHNDIDRRSLSLHRLIAEKILADPSLIEIARGNIRRWQAAREAPSAALAEWDRILAPSVVDIIAILTGTTETATRLRQSSPFAGILTEAERMTVYESHSA